MKERTEYNEVIERLQYLRGEVQRDPAMATHTRQSYLSQVAEQAPLVHPRAPFIEHFFSSWKGRSRMFKTAASVALTIAILFVGTGLTVQASQGSLPGDSLYPIKRFSEDVQTTLTIGQRADTALAVSLAQKRIQETVAVAGRAQAEEARHLSIEALIAQLDETTAKIARFQETDLEQASLLAEQLGQALAQHQHTLQQIAEQASAQQRERITKALADGQSLRQRMGQPDGGTPSQIQSDGQHKGRPADSDSADDAAVISDETPSAQQERDRDRIHTDEPGEGPQDDAGQANQKRGQERNDDRDENDDRPQDRDRDQDRAQQSADDANGEDEMDQESSDQENDDKNESEQGHQGPGADSTSEENGASASGEDDGPGYADDDDDEQEDGGAVANQTDDEDDSGDGDDSSGEPEDEKNQGHSGGNAENDGNQPHSDSDD